MIKKLFSLRNKYNICKVYYDYNSYVTHKKCTKMVGRFYLFTYHINMWIWLNPNFFANKKRKKFPPSIFPLGF